MSEYLVAISVGPVQDFIVAARRTRDLWFGSTLLSEISKAVARKVREQGGALIFPSIERDEDLEPESDLNVANVILASVVTTNPASVADAARAAGRARWNEFVDAAYRDVGDDVDRNRWEYQKDQGVLECCAAWCPLEEEKNYRESRRRVMRLLAARKSLRDFAPWRGEHRVPKSSLDGMRESVLKKRTPSRKLRFKRGEALDIVGVVKRAGNLRGAPGFPSVSRVAVDSWIRAQEPEKLASIREKCEALNKRGVLNRASGLNEEQTRLFPYEGQALMPSRYSALLDELDEDDPDRKDAEKILGDLKQAFVEKHMKEPDSYLALIVADGDKMGKAISGIETMEDHRDLSATLSLFAGEARKIVREHHGVCIYAGGDDVLAFAPLDKALQCARALRETFCDLWRREDKWRKLLGEEELPTLSVGVSVGHSLEDLEFLLKDGRYAESCAKGPALEASAQRDALAVLVRSRGNSEIVVRERWKPFVPDNETPHEFSMDRRLLRWARFFAEDAIPSRFPYELRRNAAFFENWTDEERHGEAVAAELRRIFNRKEFSGDAKDFMKKYIDAHIGNAQGMKSLADELLTALWFALPLSKTREEKA